MIQQSINNHVETNDSYPKLSSLLFAEINKLRADPKKYVDKLQVIMEKMQKNVGEDSYTDDGKEKLHKLNRSYNQAIICLSGRGLKAMHRLHASYGLSKAATDVICEIGPLSLIAPVSVPDMNTENFQEEDSLEYSVGKKYIRKYGRPGSYVFENFAYGVSNPCNILVELLKEENEMITGGKNNLLSPALRVVGLAIGPHKSHTHCVCILTANSFFEHPNINQGPGVLDKKESKAELPAFYVPQGYNMHTEDAGFKDAFRGFVIFGNHLIETNAKVNDLIRKLDSNSTGIITRKECKSYLRSLEIMTSSQINTFLSKIWGRRKAIPSAMFMRTLNSMIIRTTKKDEINKILGRVKDFFVNKKNAITDDIFTSISKGKESMLVPEFREALNQSGVCIPYSEFSLVLNAFDTEGGKITRQNFREVIDKVPIPRPYMRKNMMTAPASPQSSKEPSKGKSRPIVFDEKLKNLVGFEKSITIEEFINQNNRSSGRNISPARTSISRSILGARTPREGGTPSISTSGSRKGTGVGIDNTPKSNVRLVVSAFGKTPMNIEDQDPQGAPNFTAKVNVMLKGNNHSSGSTITNIYPDSTVKYSCKVMDTRTTLPVHRLSQDAYSVPNLQIPSRPSLAPPMNPYELDNKTPRNKLHTLFYALSPSLKLKYGANFLNSLKMDTKSKELPSKIRSLGCWVYQYPGLEFEKLGKIERDGVVKVTCETGEGKWLKILHQGVEGWILGTKADFITDRPLYDNFDKSIIPLEKNSENKFELSSMPFRRTNYMMGCGSSPGTPKGRLGSLYASTEYVGFKGLDSKGGMSAMSALSAVSGMSRIGRQTAMGIRSELESRSASSRGNLVAGELLYGQDPFLLGETTSLVNLRRFPKWGSTSIRTLQIGTPLAIKAYNANGSWVHVSLQLKGKHVQGWLPYDNIMQSPQGQPTRDPSRNSDHKHKHNNNKKGLTFKDEVQILYPKPTVIDYQNKKSSNYEFLQEIQEKKLLLKYRKKAPFIHPDEIDKMTSATLVSIEEIRKGHLSALSAKATYKKKQQLCFTILFNYQLKRYFKKWQQKVEERGVYRALEIGNRGIDVSDKFTNRNKTRKMNATTGAETFKEFTNTPISTVRLLKK